MSPADSRRVQVDPACPGVTNDLYVVRDRRMTSPGD